MVLEELSIKYKRMMKREIFVCLLNVRFPIRNGGQQVLLIL